MEYTVIAIIAAAVFVFVSRPLFGRQRRLYDIESAFELGDTRHLDYLGLRKARIEENSRELEFEYQMGKLSEQDYAVLRDGYEKEMEDVTRSLESLKTRQDYEDLIEDEVRARRRIK